jgi:uncharacterized protein (TIGR00661 family)
MKILYAIQGTGNGHLARAMEIVPILKKRKKCVVDVLISGTESELKLPFDVKYKFTGMSFVFGKRGGVDFWNTYRKLHSLRFLQEMKSLPVEKYDLIISDFEPISSWAAQLAKKPCIGLSNQVATLHPLAPKPKKTDLFGKMLLQHYAPTTFNYGLHFKAIDKYVFTPIIRSKLRDLEIKDKGFYTVYLPSYSDERIIKFLKQFKEIDWVVFSKTSKKKYKEKNIYVKPLNSDLFLECLSESKGIFANAGFGTTSEALFLNKKLLVIPMKSQYEQHCNAAMLKSMGVPVMKKLKNKHKDKFKEWLKSDDIVNVNYPDITEDIIETIIENHAGKSLDNTIAENIPYTIFQ